MSKELNTIAPKKYSGNYAGIMPTMDVTDGILVGDFAIDTSTSPYKIWQCTDNTEDAPVYKDIVTENSTTYLTSFTNASLTAGVLTVIHNLNDRHALFVVMEDNNGNEVRPDVTYIANDTLTASLSEVAPITGTWYCRVIKAGGYASSSFDPSGTDMLSTEVSAAIKEANTKAKTAYCDFIFNSAGTQEKNRYNNWDELFEALSIVEGPKHIYFEQDETIPTGTYNFDHITLHGNCITCAVKLEFPSGCKITSWLHGGITQGLLCWSSSDDSIWDAPAGIFVVDRNAAIGSRVEPFIDTTGTTFFVMTLNDNGTLLNDIATYSGYAEAPVIYVPNTASNVVLALRSQAHVDDDTIAGDGTVVVYVLSVVLTHGVGTHAGFTGNFFTINGTNAEYLTFDGTGTDLVATNVNAAIVEVAGRGGGMAANRLTAKMLYGGI
jgi:hypothetical protein